MNYIFKDGASVDVFWEHQSRSLSWTPEMRQAARERTLIHTDAIKENLLPPQLTAAQIACTYADEADMLNVVLFGQTAQEWRNQNRGKSGNMRDYATINQFLVLANMESYNAVLITQGKSRSERMEFLRELVVQQLRTLDWLTLTALPAANKPEENGED